MCVGYFLVLLDVTIVNVALPHIEGSQQARAIGIWAGIGSLALPAGPLLGGLLISAFGWRAIFLVSVPVVAVSFVAAAVAAVPRDRVGLASAINNTARQSGGVIGIPLAGAIARPS